MKVCKRLQIDYAEAVVDFEFGHRMAVPVIRGVVIPEEHHDKVMEELEKDEIERARKEDEKRRKAALGKWRKFLMGMRIVERIRQEYGEIDESVSVFGHGSTKGGPGPGRASPQPRDEDMAGGFLPEGYEEEEGEEEAPTYHASGFFPTAGAEDKDADDALVMEDEQHEPTEAPSPGAESPLTPPPPHEEAPARGGRDATKRKPIANTRTSTRQTRNRAVVVDSEEEEEGSDEDS